MNNKVFGNGTNLIKTPFFKYSNATCNYTECLEDAEATTSNNRTTDETLYYNL